MSISKFVAAATLGAALTYGSAASATVVFFQDFESVAPNTLSLTSLPGFTVSGSTVDVVGASNPYGITAASNVVDLDGTPGPARITMNTSFAFNAGDVVTLTFLLGGAQRGSAGDNFSFGVLLSSSILVSGLSGSGYLFNVGCATCSIGPSSGIGVTLAGTDPFQSTGLQFKALSAGSVAFSFGTTSRDNIGPLLDDVRLDISPSVPEPSTWAMMLIGFAGLGFATWRRKKLAGVAA